MTAERWERYAEATRVEHFAWWCEQHCIQSIDQFDGLPLKLEQWQLDMMAEALAESAEDGTVYWLTVALVIPKKNGKTSLLAAFALYHLIEDDGSPEILLAAATDKQAGRLFDTAVRFVKSDPWLDARLVVREHEGSIARADGFGVLYRVSADSGAASGYNPSLIVADELADWMTPRRRRTWGNIATAGRMARKRAMAFIISTAGEPVERIEGILGNLIDRNELEGEVERVHRALVISRNHRSRTLVYNYDARTRDPGDLEAIKAANPASWVTIERLAEVAADPVLTPGKFLQLHACVWAASEAGFIDLERWRALVTDAEVEPGDEVMLGFRGADSCALVACRRQDGVLTPLGVWESSDVALVDRTDVDDGFQQAIADQRVAAFYVSYTPEWASLVDEWRHTIGRKRMVALDVSQPGPKTAEVTERFRADALGGRVRHNGDVNLARHVAAAQLARVRNLAYLVTDRRGTPISACMAAVLAWEARAIEGPGEQRRARVMSF